MIHLDGDTWKPDVGLGRLAGRLPGYVPELAPSESGPAHALLEVARRYLRILAGRLVRAPDRAKLAFLERIGVTPTPAQAARAPVVFEMLPSAGHGRAPEATQVAATADGELLRFETEEAIGLASARLVEVRVVLPADNSSADHTPDAQGGRPFTLFDKPRRIPRELYLGHDTMLALTDGAILEVRAGMASNGNGPQHPLIWEYFDGEAWVPFLNWNDGTKHLTAPGIVSLTPAPRPSKPGTVSGRLSYWVRARCDEGPVPDRASSPAVGQLMARMNVAVGGFKEVKTRIPRLAPPANAVNAAAAEVGPPSPPPRVVVVSFVDERGASLAIAAPSGEPIANDPLLEVLKRVDGLRAPVVTPTAPTLSEWAYSGFVRIIRGLMFLKQEPPSAPAGDRKVFSALENIRADAVAEPLCTKLLLDTVFAIVESNSTSLTLEIKGLDGNWRAMPTIKFEETDQVILAQVTRGGRIPETAFANGVQADLSTTFQPFGPAPQPGATFLFSCAEVFSKPGAQVTVFTQLANPGDYLPPEAQTIWEYWNGEVWAPLDMPPTDASAFRKQGEVQFVVPANIALSEQFGQKPALWMRVQLREGGYTRTTVISPDKTPPDKSISANLPAPPSLTVFRLEYQHAPPFEPLTHCLSYSDFRWQDHGEAARSPGATFTPFRLPQETRPSLYLGFSRTLPVDRISLFFDARAEGVAPAPSWEYWDGAAWKRLNVEDGTRGLTAAGRVAFDWPGTSVPEAVTALQAEGALVRLAEVRHAARFRPGDALAVQQDDDAAAGVVVETTGDTLRIAPPLSRPFPAPRVIGPTIPLPRFGTPRHWVRISWPETPAGATAPRLAGVYLNAAWAAQVVTVRDELLGPTEGSSGGPLQLAQQRIQEGERVEVLELDGQRAAYELPLLDEELRGQGLSPEEVRTTDRDQATGRPTRVWVRWEARPTLIASGKRDRHYVLDRGLGLLRFGDDVSGMAPPPVRPGAPNVRIKLYRAGGGAAGNVPTGAISQLLGSVPGVVSVRNPLPAEGGADGEGLAGGDPWANLGGLLARGPVLAQHRSQAISATDYEQLALAASPDVAFARVVTASRSGDPLAWGVRIVVVPRGRAGEPRPSPSAELLRRVEQSVRRRCPSAAAGSVVACPPEYHLVDVEADLTPSAPADLGVVLRRSEDEIRAYLHPVSGGPGGRGWAFGQSPNLADLVQVLRSRVKGLGLVTALTFQSGGMPLGENVTIPAGALVAAGLIVVRPSVAGGCP